MRSRARVNLMKIVCKAELARQVGGRARAACAVGSTRALERAADRQRPEVLRSRIDASSGRAVGGGNVAALSLGIDAAHDAFGNRMRGCKQGESDLQHRAGGVVVAER